MNWLWFLVAVLLLGLATGIYVLATNRRIRRIVLGRRRKSKRQVLLRGLEHKGAIKTSYTSLEEVQADLEAAGLNSSQLIIGIDYTKSNQYTGKRTFGGRSLHYIDQSFRFLNPYQRVIQLIGSMLQKRLDDDNIIPTFGFGDISTQNTGVFSFTGCHGHELPVGIDEVLQRYNEITPHLKLSGPTNFAPLINEAVVIVQAMESQFHILLIVADGQVNNEEATIEAIVRASKYPLVIIMVGVGDGPWDMMEDFDDRLPQREFDNFQFVNFHKVMEMYDADPAQAEIEFALEALGELPESYKQIRRLNLLKEKPLAVESKADLKID